MLYPPKSEENVRKIVNTCVNQSPYKISSISEINKQIEQGIDF